MRERLFSRSTSNFLSSATVSFKKIEEFIFRYSVVNTLAFSFDNLEILKEILSKMNYAIAYHSNSNAFPSSSLVEHFLRIAIAKPNLFGAGRKE
jgi:hypothetical protein